MLKRRTPLKTKSRLRPRSKSASAKRRRAEQDGPQAKLCRSLSCCVCGVLPFHAQAVHAHHEPTRAAGGKDGDTVPLCPACHHDCHSHRDGRAAWWQRVGVDPEAVKQRLREVVASG